MIALCCGRALCLLVLLQQHGLGCHVAGVLMGAFLYADDLALLAPIRTILTPMLVLVEAYGASLNLTFLSDQDQVLLHLLCGTCQKGGVSRSTGAERSCSSLEGECCPSGPQATPRPFLLSRLSSEACYIYLPNC